MTKILAATCAFVCAACGGEGSNVVIHEQRTTSTPSRDVRPNATAAERFGATDMGMGMGGGDTGGAPAGLVYDLPSGWKELAVKQGHMVDVQPAGDAQSVCYLSSLPGVAGGLASNVNRWRGQLSAEPLTGEAIAALPKSPLLGHDATLVEIEGTYKGMGDTAPEAGFALLGLVVSEESGSLFLKFTGPVGVVKAEREHFLAFSGSLERSAEHAHADAAPAGAGDFVPEPAGGAALSWKAPEGWHKGPAKPMRDVNFEIGDGGECYISRLGSDGGGLRSNLDRWSGQLGNKPLSDEQFKALVPVRVLGMSTPLFESSGTFTGMDGTPRKGQALLGVACIRAQDSVFVKLLGPIALVEAERAHFLAFVASLEERQ